MAVLCLVSYLFLAGAEKVPSGGLLVSYGIVSIAQYSRDSSCPIDDVHLHFA